MKKLALLAALALCNTVSLLAVPGDFKSTGAMASSAQSNGKTIVGGQVESSNDKNIAAIQRLDSNNQLDQTYGTAGTVLIPVGLESTISLVEPLDNDKISVTGFAYSADGLAQPDLEFTAQVNADGTLNSSYGQNGLEVISLKK
jgi:hypothetical protein